MFHISNNNIPTAPAYKTAQRDYNMNLNLKTWERNLSYASKIIALPGTSAFFYKLLIRQNWTKYKNSLACQNVELGICNYCEDIDTISNTRHMFYDCSVAIKIWEIVTKLFKKSINFSLDQSFEHLIFMQGKLPVNKNEKKAITDIHTVTLHSLQKIALADTRLTEHSAIQILYRSIITTIYANKVVGRNEHIFEKIINSLPCCFKSINLLEVFNIS